MVVKAKQRTVVVLECDDLRLLFGRTVPFAALGDSRPVLNAVRLDLAKNRVIAAASDGYILGVQSSPAEVSGPLEGVTVPLEGVQAIARMIPKGHAVLGRKVRLSWEPDAPVRFEVFMPGAPAQKAIPARGPRAKGGPSPAIPAVPARPDAIEAAYEAWPVQALYPNYRALSIKAIAQFSIETDDQERAERILDGLQDTITLELLGGKVQLDQLELEPAARWLKVGGPGLATCERCGKNEPQPAWPCSIDALLSYMRYITLRHEDCREVPA